MPLISSILVGTANGCSCVNYVPAPKKINSLDSSDLTRARRLNAVAATTSLPVYSYAQRPVDYQQFQTIEYGNRVKTSVGRLFGQNFQ